MSAPIGIPALTSRTGAVCLLTAAALAGTSLLPALSPTAEAATPAGKALKVAASKKGSPYRWGAAGPKRFDCSGLTQYSFKKAGKKLPRTAAAQYNKTRRVSAKSRKKGDLVFFRSGGNIYHVGIYAGKGKIWNAPKPGTKVRKDKIWSKNVSYGRVK